MKRFSSLALALAFLLQGSMCSPPASGAPSASPTAPMKHRPRPVPTAAPPTLAPTIAPTLSPTAAPPLDTPVPTFPTATPAPLITDPPIVPTDAPTAPPTLAPPVITPAPLPTIAPTVPPTVAPTPIVTSTPILVALGTSTAYTQPSYIQEKSASATSTNTIAVTLNLAPTQNDVLYCGISQDAGSGTTVSSGPTGFSALTLGGHTQLNAGALSLAVWRHVVGASETTGPKTFTLSGSVTNVHLGCIEVAYEDSTTPELLTDAIIQSTSIASSTVTLAPNDTPSLPGTQLVFETVKGAVSGAAPGGSTLDYDDVAGTLDAHLQHQGPLTAGSLVGASVQWPPTPTAAVGASIVVRPEIAPDTIVAIATSAPAAPPPPTVPKHVKNFFYGYGYAGVSLSVPISFQALWGTWAYVDTAAHVAQYKAAGILTTFYVNFARPYSNDSPSVAYNDIKPGGIYSSAEAKNCSGVPVTDQTSLTHYGLGYIADPGQAATVNLGQAAVIAKRSNYASYDSVFSDNNLTDIDETNGPPCGYVFTTWAANNVTLYTNLSSALGGIKFWVNGLGESIYRTPSQVSAGVNSPGAWGGMFEGCYSSRFTSGGYYTGSLWVANENSEITTIALGKQFVCYGGNTSSPAQNEDPYRIYQYASFLLSYDPTLAVYQTEYTTPSAFSVMPETGFVPLTPSTTASSSVATYAIGSGLYKRAWGDCHNRGGASIGGCAVVINENASGAALAVSTGGLNHTMVLNGGGVYEGGTVSFNGPACTSLAPHTACIAVP